jgi:transposase
MAEVVNLGMIIVDPECRVVIDTLEDRGVVTCTNWFKRHLEVEVISRDRCGLYAQAAPQAKQVAVRFHIVQNLRQVIEAQMNRHGRTTGRALLSDATMTAVPETAPCR